MRWHFSRAHQQYQCAMSAISTAFGGKGDIAATWHFPLTYLAVPGMVGHAHCLGSSGSLYPLQFSRGIARQRRYRKGVAARFVGVRHRRHARGNPRHHVWYPVATSDDTQSPRAGSNCRRIEVDWGVLRCQLVVAGCPLLALSGHWLVRCTCPLSGVKRTCFFALHMSACDPKRTLTPASNLPM